MRNFLVLLFCFLPVGAWAQGHVVGNGGDGFVKDGHVVLRDLQEAGLEENPFYGKEIDPVLAVSVKFIPIANLSPSLQSKIALKLSDLNRVAPRFGDFLLAGIKMYNWALINTPLIQVPADGDIIQTPPGSEYVQIANRSGATIRIHRPTWDMMSEDHQVALLLHEVVYAMLTPRLLHGDVYGQSALKTREIVAYFFSQDLQIRGSALFNKTIKNELNVSWDTISLYGPRSLLWELKLMSRTEDGKDWSNILRIEQQNNFSMLLEVVKVACDTNPHQKKSGEITRMVAVKSDVQIWDYNVEFIEYKSAFGVQLSLKFSPRAGPYVQTLDFKIVDSPSCQQTLQSHVDLVALQL